MSGAASSYGGFSRPFGRFRPFFEPVAAPDLVGFALPCGLACPSAPMRLFLALPSRHSPGPVRRRVLRAAAAGAMIAAVAAGAAAQEAPAGTSPRNLNTTLHSFDGREMLARLRSDSAGRVTVTAGADSVSMVGILFAHLAREYVAADSLRRERFVVGSREGRALVEVEVGWGLLAIAGSVVAALVALGVALVRSRRRERRVAREAARVAEQRRRVENAREAERQVLARELHDDVLQMLYAIRLHLPAPSANGSTNTLDTVDGLVTQTAQQVRAVTARLRAPMDGTVRLPDALAALPALYPDVTGTVEVAPDALDRLSREQGVALYRVAQEAVSNAVRHGGARHIRFALGIDEANGGALVFCIDDDGSGFDTGGASSPDRPHFGLTGMRERAEALGGTLTVESAPGQGTCLRVCLVGAMRPSGQRSDAALRRLRVPLASETV